MCVYDDPEYEAWFREAWTKSGKKLDMGKSCVRFKKIDDVPLKVIGQAFNRVPTKKLIEYSTWRKSPGTNRARKAPVLLGSLSHLTVLSTHAKQSHNRRRVSR